MMKAEFMTLWDGLTTTSDTRILVLGATNRPNDIDPAILRRMPKRFPIRLPNYDQRVKILNLMLSHTSLSEDFSISKLALRTDGLSGSDLRETCRNAAMMPVQEVMREKGKLGREGLDAARKEVSDSSNLRYSNADRQGFKLRPLVMSDFAVQDSHAYAHVDPSSRKVPGAFMEPVD
jgi:SpoVK/Ycf46/Vps4 family AAA+-type ATPase